MSDCNNFDTDISFEQISSEIQKMLEISAYVNDMFPNFTNHLNRLNKYIVMHNLHGLPQQSLKRRRIDFEQSPLVGFKRKGTYHLTDTERGKSYFS
jgi:hypothetical protein